MDQCGENLPPKSRFRKWVETTASEMKVFMALITTMGFIIQEDLSDYWSTGRKIKMSRINHYFTIHLLYRTNEIKTSARGH